MKKVVSILLMVVLVLSLISCAATETEEDSIAATETEEDSIPATETEEDSIAATETEEDSIDNWPEEPVTVICPWQVGGLVDILNRQLASLAEPYLGQPMLATNELGAGGSVATTAFLNNEPNSYNFIITAEGMMAIRPNLEEVAFDYFEDFEFVVCLSASSFILSANESLNINSLEDLIEYGKDNKIVVGTTSTTSSEMFLVRSLCNEIGLDFEPIPYGGLTDAANAVAKGEVPFVASFVKQAIPHIEEGTIKPVIAFNDEGISNDLFTIKGVGEYGYTYYKNRNFVVARKGTDPRIIQKVRDTYLQLFELQEVKDLYEELLWEIEPFTTEEMAEHIRIVSELSK